jgi:hypothetical protein
MKYPDRPPRNEPYLEKYNYYDHETAVQEDGKIALFSFESKKRKKGWVFSCYVDEYGFKIWEEEDRFARWDDKWTIEQLLLCSRGKKYSLHYPPDDLNKDFKLGEDEELWPYSYGGILSGRGGWYITKKDNPMKVIRSIQTWLS